MVCSTSTEVRRWNFSAQGTVKRRTMANRRARAHAIINTVSVHLRGKRSSITATGSDLLSGARRRFDPRPNQVPPSIKTSETPKSTPLFTDKVNEPLRRHKPRVLFESSQSVEQHGNAFTTNSIHDCIPHTSTMKTTSAPPSARPDVIWLIWLNDFLDESRKDRLPDFSDFPRLPYLHCAISEAL